LIRLTNTLNFIGNKVLEVGNSVFERRSRSKTLFPIKSSNHRAWFVKIESYKIAEIMESFGSVAYDVFLKALFDPESGAVEGTHTYREV
jgi:hypothetical protein